MGARRVYRFFQLQLISLLFLFLALPATAVSGGGAATSVDSFAGSDDNVITVCVDPGWYPFEKLTDDGVHVGIAADLLNLLASRAGLKLEIVPTESWQQSLDNSRQGRCMVINFLNQTPERDEWLIFTEPYFTEYNVFITRQEHDYIANPALLVGKTVVLPRGTSIEDRVRRGYPNLEIIIVEEEMDAIRMVNDRKADMTLRSLSMAAYIIRSQGFFNLKIAGQLPEFTNELRIGVLKEYSHIRDLFNEAIATLQPVEVQQAMNNHVSIEMVTHFDYGFIVLIVLGFSVVLFLGFLWNRQLTRLNRSLADKQERLILLSHEQTLDIEARKVMEEKLRQNQQQLTNMISNLPGFIYRCSFDHDCTIHFISEGCEAITGNTPEAFMAEKVVTFSSIIHPDEREMIRLRREQAIRGKNHFQHEYRIIHADGTIRWVWERGKAIFNEDGTPRYLEGFIKDITEEVNIRQEVKEYSEMINMLMNSTAEAIYGVDREGNCIFINHACLQLLGYSSSYELLGRNMHHSIHHSMPDGTPIPEMDCGIRCTFLEGVRKHKKGDYFIRKDQSFFPVEYWSYPIEKQGEVIGAVITFFDISQELEIEKQVREKEMLYRETASRYQAFIDATNTGAWEYNHAMGDSWYSPQYFSMLGWEPEDFDLSTSEGRLAVWNELIHPDDYPQTNAYLNEYIENPEGTYEQVFRMKHKSGSYHWILSRGRMLGDPGTASGSIILGTHIDITMQKKAEETIMAKNKELESFLYVTSHDLRSPMVNIQGFGNRIQTNLDKISKTVLQSVAGTSEAAEVEKVLSDIIPRSLSVIFSNVDKMNDLINGLLAISRTGRVKMTIAPVDTNALMEKVIKAHQFQLEQAHASLSIDTLPPCCGDETLLNQLFINLIDNAIKYKKPGESLNVRIDGVHQNSHITIAIHDNGVGISERNQQKIWDIFYRVDPTAGEKGEGIGLNLAAKIVEKHRGMLWVRSKEGEGSTFFVQLPATEFRE